MCKNVKDEDFSCIYQSIFFIFWENKSQSLKHDDDEGFTKWKLDMFLISAES